VCSSWGLLALPADSFTQTSLTTRTAKEVSKMNLEVCLSLSVIGLLLSGTARGQAFASPNDTNRANALLHLRLSDPWCEDRSSAVRRPRAAR
jgi:hypothetical protein